MIETQFNNAVAQSAAAGVPVRYNDGSICCRSCYVEDNPDEVFTVSQHGAIEFHDGTAYFTEEDDECQCTGDEYDEEGDLIESGDICDACLGRSDSRRTVIGSVWFYYTNPASARTFVDALTANGIVSVWDGNPATAVEVRMNG